MSVWASVAGRQTCYTSFAEGVSTNHRAWHTSVATVQYKLTQAALCCAGST